MNDSLQPSNTPSRAALTTLLGEMTEQQFTEALPHFLIGTLERRYLTDFQHEQYDITPVPEDRALPLLRQVTALGRPSHANDWIQAMPQVLNACHDPGHALLMMVHGEQQREQQKEQTGEQSEEGNTHRIYLGTRRLPGGARSTEDQSAAQVSAFKALVNGMETGEPRRMDASEMGQLLRFLESAPALGLITGIPSGRNQAIQGLSTQLQSLDRLVQAIGEQEYLLQVVAEPVRPEEVDATLDRCRRLKSEIHSFVRRTHSHSDAQTSSVSQTVSQASTRWMDDVPAYLSLLAAFCGIVGVLPATAVLRSLGAGLHSSAIALRMLENPDTDARSRQTSTGTTNSTGGSTELLNANAEACERLLQRHIDRLEAGRSGGWWRTAVYIAAASEATLYSVASALRSIASGDATSLDPIRLLTPPAALVREAMRSGRLLSLRPKQEGIGSPLGEIYDSLTTCMASHELAVLVNMPQREIPGLRMRTQSEFALTAPSPQSDQVILGRLKDNQKRDLGAVGLPALALNRHVFITGTTGYGKTNTCMHILLEAYRKLKIPFLVIEPAKTEYRAMAQIPDLQNHLRVYSIGPESPCPFRLNPFEWSEYIPLTRHIDMLKAVFNSAFAMGAGMPEVLEQAIVEVYTERGWSLYTSKNRYLSKRPSPDEVSALMPNLEDLHRQIEHVMERKAYGQEIHRSLGAALRSRIEGLMMGNKGITLNTRRSTPMTDLFENPTIIELENLGNGDEQAFIMALLFVQLHEYARARQHRLPPEERKKLQHLTLIEEAHRLLSARTGNASAEQSDPRGKAVSMFTDALAEMRSQGEGFLIADQTPTQLASQTLKNSNVKIVMRLNSMEERIAVGSSMNLTEGQIQHINNLSAGQAIIHDERIGEAVLVEVPLIKDGLDLEADPGTLPGQDSLELDRRSYLHRHAGCAKCQSPCDFYYQFADSQLAEEMQANEIPSEQRQMPNPLSGFFDQLLLGNALGDMNRAWSIWKKWRTDLLTAYGYLADGSGALEAAESAGTVYCTGAQFCHAWVTNLLQERKRSKRQSLLSGAGATLPVEGGSPRTPERPAGQPASRPTTALRSTSPAERGSSSPIPQAPSADRGHAPNLDAKDILLRETVLTHLAPLLRAWCDSETLTDNAQTVWTQSAKELHEHFSTPPSQERAFCATCIHPCRLLPLVTPHVHRLNQTVRTLVLSTERPEQRFALLQQTVENDRNTGTLPLNSTNDQSLLAGWLYCLITHLDMTDANLTAPTMRTRRDELMELLRVRASAGFSDQTFTSGLSDIVRDVLGIPDILEPNGTNTNETEKN